MCAAGSSATATPANVTAIKAPHPRLDEPPRQETRGGAGGRGGGQAAAQRQNTRGISSESRLPVPPYHDPHYKFQTDYSSLSHSGRQLYCNCCNDGNFQTKVAVKSTVHCCSMLRSAAGTAAAVVAGAAAALLWRHIRARAGATVVYYDDAGRSRSRFVFAGNKLPGRDYDNFRLPMTYIGPRPTDYDCPEFTKVMLEGRLECNLDRVPVLEVCGEGGFALGQSPAIARFIGRELGLMGRSDAEAAQVDAVVEHVRDIRHAFATFRGSNSWFGETDPDWWSP